VLTYVRTTSCRCASTTRCCDMADGVGYLERLGRERGRGQTRIEAVRNPYSYTIVNERTVLVDPRTREIVAVIR
jgi:hypothetical protein